MNKFSLNLAKGCREIALKFLLFIKFVCNVLPQCGKVYRRILLTFLTVLIFD